MNLDDETFSTDTLIYVSKLDLLIPHFWFSWMFEFCVLRALFQYNKNSDIPFVPNSHVLQII